jgi:hypothetical protein
VTKDEIEKYLAELNDELRAMNIKGEVCVYGGAVMCLAFNARPSTKDVGAIFEPVKCIRRAAGRIAERYNLPKDWLNNAVKIFLVEHQKRILFAFSHLTVYVPEADYLLAMKTLAGRIDSSDRADVQFLIRALDLKGADEVTKIVAHYYPRKKN